MGLVLVVALVLGAGGVAAMPALAADDPGVQPQVVGGTTVPNGEYPFVAALLDTRFGSTPTEQQFCTGTLIDQNSVLTVAHCVVGTSPRPLRVVVGRTVLSKSDQGQERRVSSIFVHPRYNGKRSDAYDAAVLELNDSVSAIAPLKLAASNQNFLEKPGHMVKIAAWGKTESGYPDRMHKVRVPVVPDTYARKVYGRFLRLLERASLAARGDRSSVLRPHLAASRASIRGLVRSSKQFRRNCPKRVLGTLLAWIWPVHGGQNGSRSTVSVARRASLQAHPRLFGQFRRNNSQKFAHKKGRSPLQRVRGPVLIEAVVRDAPLRLRPG